MTEEQIAFLAETLAEEIEGHHDNHIDVDVGIHDLAVLAGEEMAKSGIVHDLVEALEKADLFFDHLKTTWDVCEHTQTMTDQIKAALSKARGQS